MEEQRREKVMANPKSPTQEFIDNLEKIARSEYLKKYAMVLTHNNEALSKDLVQETICRALKNWQQFKPVPGSSMKAWTSTILRNSYYAGLQKTRREVPDPDSVHANSIAIEPTQESHMRAREMLGKLAQLNEQDREILIRAGQDHSYGEITEALNVPLGTAKSRISRARKKLRDMEPE